MTVTAAALFVAHVAKPAVTGGDRIGVYVLAALFGLLVTGIIACAKEIRADMADRNRR